MWGRLKACGPGVIRSSGRLAFLRRLLTRAAQAAMLPHFIESTHFIDNRRNDLE